MHKCKNCGASLPTTPEKIDGQWILRCLECGVKNIIVAKYEVIGWRE
jgi:DNA-directed RNA polymerase subunit RPC12/RpoP